MRPRSRKRAERKNDRRVGRRARTPLLGEDTPGGIFLAALVAAAPIVALFVIGPAVLASRQVFPMDEWEVWRFLFYVLTPGASALALWMHRRAPGHVQDHNAARAGRKLAWANLVIWLVFGALYLAPLLLYS